MNGRYGSTSYSKEIDNSISYIIENKPDFVISGDHVAGEKKRSELPINVGFIS